MDAIVIVAILTLVGNLIVAILQLVNNKSTAQKASAEAKSIISKNEREERSDEFNLLRDLNGELKSFIADQKVTIKELTDERNRLEDEITVLEAQLEDCGRKLNDSTK